MTIIDIIINTVLSFFSSDVSTLRQSIDEKRSLRQAAKTARSSLREMWQAEHIADDVGESIIKKAEQCLKEIRLSLDVFKTARFDKNEVFRKLSAHHIYVATRDKMSGEDASLFERCCLAIVEVACERLPQIDSVHKSTQSQILKSLETINSNTEKMVERIKQHADSMNATPTRQESLEAHEVVVSVSRITATSPLIIPRDKELASLDAAWLSPQTNLVSIVRRAGEGKTSLVNAWLKRMLAADNYAGAQCILAWSFHNQGATETTVSSADEFIYFALRKLSDPGPCDGSAWDKGARLASLIRKNRTVLILDGVEVLQHPPGPIGSNIEDDGLRCLVRELAAQNNGLCVITSQFPLSDLEDYSEPLVDTIDLPSLTDSEGARLLQLLGVTGNQKEREGVARDLGGNVLAISLLGNYLKRACRGNIFYRDEVRDLFEQSREGEHVKSVITLYEEMFKGKPELDILRIMGLLDRPATSDAVCCLRSAPYVRGLTTRLRDLSEQAWNLAIRNLRDAELLTPEDPQDPQCLDSHPLIRKCMRDQLRKSKPKAWEAGHRRLYDYYVSVVEKESLGSIEDTAPLYAAITHGCAAGLHPEVLDNVYWRKLQQEREFVGSRPTSPGANLAALAQFFEEPWEKPASTLSPKQKAFVLQEAGHYLFVLGRASEALQPMRKAIEGRRALEDWAGACRNTHHLRLFHLTLGHFDIALQLARESVILADRSEDDYRRMATRCGLAQVHHYMGRLVDAKRIFEEAERIQAEMEPRFPILCSFWGFFYCEFLVTQRRTDQVQDRAMQALDRARIKQEGPLIEGLHHLSIAQSLTAQIQETRTSSVEKLCVHIDSAANGIRQSGQQHHLCSALLARAKLARILGNNGLAARDLAEVQEIVERSGMRIYDVDRLIELSHLLAAMGDMTSARTQRDLACDLVLELGYHRRDNDLADLDCRSSR